MDHFLQIKKYLFLLAFVISTMLGIHIVIVYLYDEAEMVAERGGTFSIGATGLSPSLNPTQYTLDTLNDFLLRFLYRWLLRYNPETKTMEGDLANCDITKNLGEIRCFFKPGAVWSDGTKVTVEDALATYSLLAETDTNKKLQSSLSKFAITREDTALVFRSTNSSIETLQLLTIPVIKKSVSERIRNEGKFQEEAYSGPYKLDKRDSDSVRMSDNVILVANDILQKNGSYSRIILKVYSDKESLANQKDSLNLVFPSYYDDVDMGQRFSENKILTPDFVGAFLNSERITLDRRKVLSGIINKIVENSEKQLQPIKNPFFTDSSLVQPLSEDVDADLKKVGYLRKKDLPKNETTATHAGTVAKPIVVPVTPKPEIIPTPIVTPITAPVVKPAIKTLSFITAPSRKAIVSLPLKTEIQIEGNVPNWVTAVFVNGYQLKGYVSGDSRFVYRARTEIGNLKKGSNTYSLAFEKNGRKETMESIVIHNGDGFVVEEPVEKTETPPVAITPPVSTGSTSSGIEMATGSGIIPSSTSSGITVSHTGSIPTTVSWAIAENTGTTASGTASGGILHAGTGTELIPKVEPVVIDDGKLYFKNGTPVKLIVRIMSPKTEISEVSKNIVAGLEKIGFEIQFEEVESSSSSLGESKNYESKNYDVFITGVNLGYMGTYIMPYFHSGQVQNGFNFSLIRNPALDILLEELKTKDLTIESRTREFEKINDILKKETVLIPIGTSPLTSFIDKNIQDFKMPSFLPSAIFIDSAVLKSYINKSYIVKFEKKTVKGFFAWCTEHLFPNP